MPLVNAQDPALDAYRGEADDGEIPPIESGPRPLVRRGLWGRLVGAGALVRSALRVTRGDPEARAVLEAAETLERGGGVVFARLEGWPRPPVVQGFVPDVYAVFDDREIVLSFENEGSIHHASTQQRAGAFAVWASASPRRIHEQIVIPGGRGGRG
jgi:hypothetical protein